MGDLVMTVKTIRDTSIGEGNVIDTFIEYYQGEANCEDRGYYFYIIIRNSSDSRVIDGYRTLIIPLQRRSLAKDKEADTWFVNNYKDRVSKWLSNRNKAEKRKVGALV
jgi:hypothetical protein